ncbi:DUF2345 domain-containing protein [Flavobacterium aquidurense]|uniref:DUF2345 domain-containing protein n=1 Tax=Flavobacterium aquidurense TaxID=362413 RepID=UPI003715A721
MTTPETFTVRAKNIVFEATESITIKAGTNIIQEAGNDINISAGGNLTEHGNEKIELIEEKITINSAEHIEMAEKINMNATNGDMILKASETIHANSGENSSFN